MTDYTALAESALNHEGADAYFGEIAYAAIAAAEINVADLVRILADALAAHGVPDADEDGWDCPDAVVTDCTAALAEMLPTVTREALAADLGCTVADLEALITGDSSDSFDHYMDTGRLDLAEVATLTDAIAELTADEPLTDPLAD